MKKVKVCITILFALTAFFMFSCTGKNEVDKKTEKESAEARQDDEIFKVEIGDRKSVV